jgi:ubiquitin carboxyl-terminal hydrolase 5/13
VTPETPIQFDKYLVPRGLQPGETALPEDSTTVDSLPALNEAAYAQLQEMGFPAPRAEKALRMTGNESADVAMQWLFEHMEDDDIDVPFSGGAGGGVVEVDVESLNGLMGLGFEEAHARKALRETVRPPPPTSPVAHDWTFPSGQGTDV